jgi:hypothetical protein
MYKNNTLIAPIYTNIYENAKNEESNTNSNIDMFIKIKIKANSAWIALGVPSIKNNKNNKVINT